MSNLKQDGVVRSPKSLETKASIHQQSSRQQFQGAGEGAKPLRRKISEGTDSRKHSRQYDSRTLTFLDNFGNVMKERAHEKSDSANDEEEEEEEENNFENKGRRRRNNKMVVDEESSKWPLDADAGRGIRASEYFEKHSIKNVVGEYGLEIDWEGDAEDSWVKEINCLERESFAFHPNPLIVLVLERYNKATDNWKTLKELEKAATVYWSAKDRLPPRTVKCDINIEMDMAYSLKVKECPPILFLRGHWMMHREKEFRTADQLVQMIAHFYYNARKPLCMKDAD